MVLLKNQGDFKIVSILYDHNSRYKLDDKLCGSVEFNEVEFAYSFLKLVPYLKL